MRMVQSEPSVLQNAKQDQEHAEYIDETIPSWWSTYCPELTPWAPNLYPQVIGDHLCLEP